MKMCINKKAVVGVAVAALVLLAIAPRFLAGAAPLLVMAICPLSMVFMMRGMSGRDDAAKPEPTSVQPRGRDHDLREMEEEVNRLKAELALRDQDRTA